MRENCDVHYFVGGPTRMDGAALYRLRTQDLGELRQVDGVSPAWPLTHDAFEPLRHTCGIMLDKVERPRAPGSESGGFCQRRKR